MKYIILSIIVAIVCLTSVESEARVNLTDRYGLSENYAVCDRPLPTSYSLIPMPREGEYMIDVNGFMVGVVTCYKTRLEYEDLLAYRHEMYLEREKQDKERAIAKAKKDKEDKARAQAKAQARRDRAEVKATQCANGVGFTINSHKPQGNLFIRLETGKLKSCGFSN